MTPEIPPMPHPIGKTEKMVMREITTKNINPPPDQGMGHGPAGVTRKTIGVHFRNAGVHQNEKNTGVHENTNVPHNDHTDPQNDPIIKIENMTDGTEEEDENEEWEEASMGSEER